MMIRKDTLLYKVSQLHWFLLLTLMATRPMTSAELRRFRLILLAFVAVHVGFAHVQAFVLGYEDDQVKGVLLGSAGHHTGGAIALTAAVDLLFSRYPPIASVGLRVLGAVLCVLVTITSDSKQVVAVFLAALPIALLLNMRHVRKTLLLLAFAPAAIALFHPENSHELQSGSGVLAASDLAQ